MRSSRGFNALASIHASKRSAVQAMQRPLSTKPVRSPHAPEPSHTSLTSSYEPSSDLSSAKHHTAALQIQSARQPISRRLLTALIAALTAAWTMQTDRLGPCQAATRQLSSPLSEPSSSGKASGPQMASVVVKDDSGSVRAFSSISEALEAAGPGSYVRVAAGRYVERLRFTRPVIVEAFPEGADVEVVWETDEPYQHTVEISCRTEQGRVEIKGLKIRHFSKSVADNYGVYISAGSPLLNSCDIVSRSGSGVGVEGALRPRLVQCRIHGCERHGVAVFRSIENDSDVSPPALDGANAAAATFPILQSCEIDGNKLVGVLVREYAGVQMVSCAVHDNGGYGVSLQDAVGALEGNVLSGNNKGEVIIRANVFDLRIRPEDLKDTNSIQGTVLVL